MRFVDQWQRPLYMASVSGKSIFIWLGVWFSHTPRIHHESRPFEFQVLSPNIEMAKCGILFGLRHQNEAWHTKGSRGHSPTFHLFNFLSLACNLYLSRSWNICPKSPSVHPASQERHLAINMTERTFRRSRGRFVFLFAPVPQACFKRNPWNRGSVNRIPLHRSYCYLLFISVTTTLFCEMVNPQNVSTTQTGFYRLYTIFTYTGYTHSTHNLPIPPCFHSKKPLSTGGLGNFHQLGMRFVHHTDFRKGANDENLTVRRGFLELMDTMPQAPNFHVETSKMMAVFWTFGSVWDFCSVNVSKFCFKVSVSKPADCIFAAQVPVLTLWVMLFLKGHEGVFP